MSSFGQSLRPPIETNDLRTLDKFKWQGLEMQRDSLSYWSPINQNSFTLYRPDASFSQTYSFPNDSVFWPEYNIWVCSGCQIYYNDSIFYVRRDPECAYCWDYSYNRVEWKHLFCESKLSRILDIVPSSRLVLKDGDYMEWLNEDSILQTGVTFIGFKRRAEFEGKTLRYQNDSVRWLPSPDSLLYIDSWIHLGDTLSNVSFTDSLYDRIAEKWIFSGDTISSRRDSMTINVFTSDTITSIITYSDTIYSQFSRIDTIYSQISRVDTIYSQISRADTIYSQIIRVDSIYVQGSNLKDEKVLLVDQNNGYPIYTGYLASSDFEYNYNPNGFWYFTVKDLWKAFGDTIITPENNLPVIASTYHIGDSTNIKYSLPAVDGDSLKFLRTDGHGNVYWSAPDIAYDAPPLFAGDSTMAIITLGDGTVRWGRVQPYQEPTPDPNIYADSFLVRYPMQNLVPPGGCDMDILEFNRLSNCGFGSYWWNDVWYKLKDYSYTLDSAKVWVNNNFGKWTPDIYGMHSNENIGIGVNSDDGFMLSITAQSNTTALSLKGYNDSFNQISGYSGDGTNNFSVYNNGGIYSKTSLKVGTTGTTITRTGSIAEKDIWTGTQAEYDLLTPVGTTLYFIHNGNGIFGIIFLMLLSFGSKAQNWSSVKVGSTDVNRIYKGGDIIWEKPSIPTGGQFVMKTSSTSSAFKFESSKFYVANSGAALHWEVTGAVTASYDGDYPTFDFSTPGEKIITVTSADNLLNLTELVIYDLPITSLKVSNLVNLTQLVIFKLSITSLDLNNILDQLIAIGNNGSYAFVSPTCADASKIAALDAIWDEVYITPCN